MSGFLALVRVSLLLLASCTKHVKGAADCGGVGAPSCRPTQGDVPATPSYLNVRMHVPFSRLSWESGGKVPRVITEGSVGGLVQWGFYRRLLDPIPTHCAPIELSRIDDARVRVMAPIEFRITGLGFGCGNPKRPDMHVLGNASAEASIALRREDFQIAVGPNPKGTLDITEGGCSGIVPTPVGIYPLPLDWLVELLGSAALYNELTSAKLDLREDATKVWNDLNKVHVHEGTHVVLNPVTWAFENPTIDPSGVNLDASILARPAVGVGVQPVRQENPIPTPVGQRYGTGFQLVIPIQVPFSKLANLGKGEVLEAHGKKFVIQALEATNSGAKLGLHVTLEEPTILLDGYFSSVPSIVNEHPYDHRKGLFIHLADLVMDTNTHNPALATLGNLFAKDEIAAELRKRSVIELTDAVAKLKAEINDYLDSVSSSKEADADVEVTEVSVVRIDLALGSIIVWMKLAGEKPVFIDVKARGRRGCTPYPGAGTPNDEF